MYIVKGLSIKPMRYHQGENGQPLEQVKKNLGNLFL